MAKRRPKDIGTEFETWLIGDATSGLASVWPQVARAALRGIHDAGDFINTRHVLVEAKKRKAFGLRYSWLKKTKDKARKQKRPWAVIHAGNRTKTPGVFVVMDLDDWLAMMRIVYGRRQAEQTSDPFAGL